MVGDGSYLMMATELATAVQEGIKIIVVLVQNHGFASIGSLSESLGSQRFGTAYRYRNAATGRLDGEVPAGRPGRERGQLRARGDQGREHAPSSPTRSRSPRPATAPIVIYVETDPLIDAPSSRVVVGRAGERHLDPGVHPAGPRDLRGAQGRPAALPHADRTFLARPTPTSPQKEHHRVPWQDHYRHRPGLVGRLVPQRPRAAPADVSSSARSPRPGTRRSSSARTATCRPIRPSCGGPRRARAVGAGRHGVLPPASAGRLGLHLEAGDRRGRADPGGRRRAHRGHPGAVARPQGRGDRRRAETSPTSSGAR